VIKKIDKVIGTDSAAWMHGKDLPKRTDGMDDLEKDGAFPSAESQVHHLNYISMACIKLWKISTHSDKII